MFIQFTCKECNEKKKNEIYEVLGALCQREQIQIEDTGDMVKISACPQGIIKVVEEDDNIVLSANTRYAGAGFHAFVVDFCQDIAEEFANETGKFDLYDDLKYDEDGDFDRLQQLYEDEAEYLRSVLLENPRFRKQNYLYEETFFLPLEKDNHIHTILGSVKEEAFQNKDIQELMDYFYVWNEWDKDARFYRNCALYLLAKEGVGQYTMMNEHTEKQARLICDYIELAYEKDPNIALPIDEYDELIHELERDNKLSNPKLMNQTIDQYKKKDVYHLYKDLKIVADGACERNVDFVSDSLCLMSPFIDENWDYLLQASPNGDILLRKEEVEKAPTKEKDQKAIQMVEYQENGIYYIESKVTEKKDVMYIRTVCADAKWLPYLKRCIQESTFQKE
ncbi:MAG: hypothetical protein KBT48_03675 [Firmicutes bacterium]|nr:hypothetical protein [Bacillota bacterium]